MAGERERREKEGVRKREREEKEKGEYRRGERRETIIKLVIKGKVYPTCLSHNRNKKQKTEHSNNASQSQHTRQIKYHTAFISNDH